MKLLVLVLLSYNKRRCDDGTKFSLGKRLVKKLEKRKVMIQRMKCRIMCLFLKESCSAFVKQRLSFQLVYSFVLIKFLFVAIEVST